MTYGERVVHKSIDRSFSFARHFIQTSSFRIPLYCMRRCKYYMSQDGRRMLFNALIMPYFTYAIELWFTANQTSRGTLELLLRYCLRIVLNDTGPIPTTANIYLYISLNILPLSGLLQLRLGSMVYRAIKFNISPPIKNLLIDMRDNKAQSSMNLRDGDPLAVPLIRLETCRARIGYYGRRLWNHVGPNLRAARTESDFISMYTDYLIDRLVTARLSIPTTKFYDYM